MGPIIRIGFVAHKCKKLKGNINEKMTVIKTVTILYSFDIYQKQFYIIIPCTSKENSLEMEV